MNTTATDPLRTLPGRYDNVPTFEERSILGKDSFLKLLVTQLQHQDPLEPQQDREFIAQMAQFSTLEQMTNLATSMNKFLEYQMNASIVQYSNMIGQKVYWESVESDGTKLSGEGLVQAVSYKNGQIYFELDNGQKVSIENIVKIEQHLPEEVPPQEEVLEQPGEEEQGVGSDELIAEEEAAAHDGSEEVGEDLADVGREGQVEDDGSN